MNDHVDTSAKPIIALAVRFKDEWFDVREFVTPNQVMVMEQYWNIIPQNVEEDQAIIACWNWVAQNIRYPEYTNGVSDYHRWEAYTTKRSGGTKPVVSFTTTGEFWDFPHEVLSGKISDCQGSSSLLTSMLRNFIPESRVNMSVGNMGSTGHAWVRIERRGMWFVLESTLSRLPKDLWKPEIEASKYSVKLIFNDVDSTELQPIDDLLPVRREILRHEVASCWGRGCV